MFHEFIGQLVPVVAVVFIFGGSIIKRLIDVMERRMEMRINTQDQNTASQIAAMRQELAQLRDTSTQYDMSIEHRLDDMERRLSSVEGAGQSTRPVSPPPPSEQPAQRIGMPLP